MAKIYAVSTDIEPVDGFLPALTTDQVRSALTGAHLADFLYSASQFERQAFFQDLLRAVRLTQIAIPVASRVYLRSFLKKAYRVFFEQRMAIQEMGIAEDEVFRLLMEIEEEFEDMEVVRLIGSLSLQHVYYHNNKVVGIKDVNTIKFGYPEEDAIRLALTLSRYIGEEDIVSVLRAEFNPSVLRIQALLYAAQTPQGDAKSIVQYLWVDKGMLHERVYSPSLEVEIPNLLHVTMR